MTQKPTLLLSRRWPASVETHLSERFNVTLNDADIPLTRDELAVALCAYDAICPTITDRFDAEMFAGPSLRVRILANFGAGIEHIHLAAARAAGIVVTNTPEALTEATAELTILLMLMAARRAGEGERELRGGLWTGWRPTHMIGQGLQGKTLGLVGYGRIAKATAALALAHGMHVLHHSRRANDAPGRVATLEALAEQADILSLHIPGGSETRHLVDAALLSRMKPSAILVNTARGSVIDEAALARALANGQIAAAGLDVYEGEPVLHPDLLACENVVLLPHLGSATIETRTAMGMQAAANLEAFFAGYEPANRVA